MGRFDSNEVHRFIGAVAAVGDLPFVAPETEAKVLTAIAAHVASDGIVVVGFGVDRGYALADLDRHARSAGPHTEYWLATWDLRPWEVSSEFAVTVLASPGT